MLQPQAGSAAAPKRRAAATKVGKSAGKLLSQAVVKDGPLPALCVDLLLHSAQRAADASPCSLSLLPCSPSAAPLPRPSLRTSSERLAAAKNQPASQCLYCAVPSCAKTNAFDI